ncbi:MAG: hypothetical protein HQL15_02365 [Candidatus Omnitrophica bacterium]|nr:hypothetical protein [Candidatus Omnitrophota bacterium]
MKALILSLALLCVPLSGAWASYTSTLTVLEKKDIAKLTDEQLTDAYMNALVDVEARKDFFNRFGLVGKDLDDYKAVLKYRLVLLMEIHGRNLDIPQFERY